MVGLQQKQIDKTDARRRKQAIESLYEMIRSAKDRANSG